MMLVSRKVYHLSKLEIWQPFKISACNIYATRDQQDKNSFNLHNNLSLILY